MRRTSLLAAVTAGLLLVSACGSDTDDPPPTTTTAAADQDATTSTGTPEPADDVESTTAPAPSPTSEAPSPTTPTDTATGTSDAPEPSPSETGAAPEPGTPSGGPVPTPPEGVECSSGAYTPGSLRTGGAPQPVVDTAEAMFHAAMECNEDTLIFLADADSTSLSFGGGTPQDHLSLPDVENRYLTLAVLLTATSPVQNDDLTWVWPAAFAGGDDAAWQELVDAGLYPQDEVDRMRAEGYSGWRIGIAQDGTWSFFIAGD